MKASKPNQFKSINIKNKLLKYHSGAKISSAIHHLRFMNENNYLIAFSYDSFNT